MKIHNPKDMIFVFGSNLSGIHGAGAAKFARQQKNAVLGVGEGMTGDCYALPTKGIDISFMPMDDIRKHVQKFMKYAYDSRKTHEFQVTRIGTGLSGFEDIDMAEMFWYVAHEESNCFFDTAWQPFLPPSAKFWGSFT